jgi:PPOX class probable F420-dependent enzyme
MLRSVDDKAGEAKASGVGGGSDGSHYIARVSEATARAGLLSACNPDAGWVAADHSGLVDTDGEHILINTAERRQKELNVRRDPRVAVNVVDPANAWRVAMVRGRVVEVTTAGADQLIDQLAKKYLNEETYPFRRPEEVRVTLKILPEKINEIGLEEAA